MRPGLVVAFFVVSMCMGPRSADAEPGACVPAALVDGDPRAVTPLREQLIVLGVASEPSPRCPVVRVTVTRRDDGVRVALREPSGRSAARTVSDARIAATWIDSWLRPDLGAPLLAFRSAPARYPAAPAPVSVSEPAPPTPPAEHGWSLGALIERASASDDSTWRAARVDLCKTVDGVCVGGLARVGEDQRVIDGVEESRYAADLLAAVSVPVELGRATVAPRAGVGAGLIHTRRIQSCSPDGDPDLCVLDPDGDVGSESAVRATIAARLETGVDLSVPLGEHLFLDLAASMDLTLGLGGGDPPPTSNPPAPECADPDGGPTDECNSSPAVDAFYGDPQRFWRVGIGLRLGGR